MVMCAGITLERSVLERLANMTEAAGAWLVRHARGIKLQCTFPLLVHALALVLWPVKILRMGHSMPEQHASLGLLSGTCIAAMAENLSWSAQLDSILQTSAGLDQLPTPQCHTHKPHLHTTLLGMVVNVVFRV